MIIDKLENIEKYTCIPRVSEIAAFLKNEKLSELTPGDRSISGDALFVKILRYEPQPSSKGVFEVHRKYADVQVVLKGKELVQIAPTEQLRKLDIEAKDDFEFFEAHQDISDFLLSAGHFAVFFPGLPHKPACSFAGNTDEVHKLVFKTTY